ncbi:MAG: RICIN domain-containing protein [Phreatobacter sp.]
MRHTFTTATILALMALSNPAHAQSPDPAFYYKLSTQFRGTGMPLDVFNGGPRNNQARLDAKQNVSGQNWRFIPAENGSYRLTTEFRGARMCLDINPPTNRPELRNCGNYSGQLWQVVPAGQWVRLTTSFRGPGLCLDIDPDSNQPELRACGNFTGQLWQLSRTSERVD